MENSVNEIMRYNNPRKARPAMSDHPILFSGPMVLAILAGRKTQTRRTIKHIPSSESPYIASDGFAAKSPCHVGDILWVRETWQVFEMDEDGECYGPYAKIPKSRPHHASLAWAASPITSGIEGPWRPSIHMPRWASRIQLRVKSVRIQRVQDISERDAWKEGCEKGDRADNGSYFPKLVPILNKQGEHVCDQGFEDAREWFAWNWNRIYGEANFDEVNPWVWAIEFERINPLNP